MSYYIDLYTNTQPYWAYKSVCNKLYKELKYQWCYSNNNKESLDLYWNINTYKHPNKYDFLICQLLTIYFNRALIHWLFWIFLHPSSHWNFQFDIFTDIIFFPAWFIQWIFTHQMKLIFYTWKTALTSSFLQWDSSSFPSSSLFS